MCRGNQDGNVSVAQREVAGVGEGGDIVEGNFGAELALQHRLGMGLGLGSEQSGDGAGVGGLYIGMTDEVGLYDMNGHPGHLNAGSLASTSHQGCWSGEHVPLPGNGVDVVQTQNDQGNVFADPARALDDAFGVYEPALPNCKDVVGVPEATASTSCSCLTSYYLAVSLLFSCLSTTRHADSNSLKHLLPN